MSIGGVPYMCLVPPVPRMPGCSNQFVNSVAPGHLLYERVEGAVGAVGRDSRGRARATVISLIDEIQRHALTEGVEHDAKLQE
jgi:hypothetical protein